MLHHIILQLNKFGFIFDSSSYYYYHDDDNHHRTNHTLNSEHRTFTWQTLSDLKIKFFFEISVENKNISGRKVKQSDNLINNFDSRKDERRRKKLHIFKCYLIVAFTFTFSFYSLTLGSPPFSCPAKISHFLYFHLHFFFHEKYDPNRFFFEWFQGVFSSMFELIDLKSNFHFI